MDHARLVQILRPDTVLPHVHQLTVNGRLRHPGMISSDTGQADHRWLNTPAMVRLIADISTHSPIEFLLLQSLSWGDVQLEVRASLRAMRSVRALMVHDVDFWTSNQYLMTLNAYPNLQFLSVWHADFHALTHVDAQLQRTEPLLLTELIVGCAYTGLLMEWLLGGGRREMLAVEEITLDSRDIYRDDARLARVLRRVGPWLKRLYYMEYSALDASADQSKWPRARGGGGCSSHGPRLRRPVGPHGRRFGGRRGHGLIFACTGILVTSLRPAVTALARAAHRRVLPEPPAPRRRRRKQVREPQQRPGTSSVLFHRGARIPSVRGRAREADRHSHARGDRRADQLDKPVQPADAQDALPAHVHLQGLLSIRGVHRLC
ncbi:hypothetical protein L227DRAFT_70333 [Lentinus tigrinus ALCF2SS1-6]|uniref:Uncharacterized protein n=1 Tax=Lentinus tigrinus ALCF2SS1-6 TaxID=1328759 RepID=A0A5C2SCK2_9APHY|nr:hypothetical protein L227DRAFT_70333 [Lentinus tigrinus ALCF2SS1-6]